MSTTVLTELNQHIDSCIKIYTQNTTVIGRILGVNFYAFKKLIYFTITFATLLFAFTI